MIRKQHRKKAKRRRIFLMTLAVFLLYFFAGPALSDKVGEITTVIPDAIPTALTVSPDKASGKSGNSEKTIETTARNKSSEYLILVNKTHSIDKNYEPTDLQTANPRIKGGSQYQQLRKVVAKAFKKLSNTAGERGLTIKLVSAYRPYSYQKHLFEKYVDKDGRYRAEQYSAEPGHSEHQTGLAADVSSPSVNYNLVQAYGTTEEGKWLAENAHKYGFIIRFPKGKEKITGYDYEPWHIRYVGKAAAKEIYKQKLTLEEYMEEVD